MPTVSLAFRRAFASAFFLISMTAGILNPANAQGFMVKPMSLELTPRPGESVVRAIEARNLFTNQPHTLQFIPTLLTQTDNGLWNAIESPQKGDATALEHSCRDWISTEADTVTIPPMSARSVNLRIKVPLNARGFYSGALLVRSVPPKASTGKVALVIQFLIPILISVQGPAAREQISLTDVDMCHTKKNDTATTLVFVQLTNGGETFVHSSSNITILRQAGARWQRVAEARLSNCDVIPGVKVNLSSDLKRRLPSGKYKLLAELQMGGKYLSRLVKEIDFVGDPTIKSVASDINLMLQPPEAELKAVPGSVRSTVLTVQNPDKEPLQVQCVLVQPPGLRGVSMGTITGEAFTCSSWCDVSPRSFTLPGGGQRNIRVTARFPADSATQANCYSLLILRASYADGQTAGDTQSLLWVQNTNTVSALKAQPIRMTIGQQEGDRYAVNAQFGNVGNIHFAPTASATLADGIGQTVKTAPLEAAERRVLPLGTPLFAGSLDFSDVKPGGYILSATMQYDDKEKRCSISLPLKVEVKNNHRIVTVIDQTAGKEKPQKPAR